MAFLGQVSLFQFVSRGVWLHPVHFATGTARDDVGGFLFRQRSEITTVFQLFQYRFGIRFGFQLDHAEFFAFRLAKAALMLVVIGADIRFGNGHFILQCCGIQRDKAHFHLLWCDEAVLVLLEEGLQLFVGDGLLGHHGIEIDRRQTHLALLQNQGNHRLCFAWWDDIGTAEALDHLLVD
ncbi:hypothetical protein D3C78_1396450 [compost metagenome]